MKKRFAQFMLMLMVAIVPYTATPFVSPASAEGCLSVVDGLCVSNPVPVIDVPIPGGTCTKAACCSHINSHGNSDCGPPPACDPFCI